MQLTGETKVLAGIVIFSLALIGIGAIMFSQPEKEYTRSEMITADTNKKGNPQATVYLVEFSDFQCPGCGAAFPFVSDIVAEHSDKLEFGYRHFPFAQHDFAQLAAEAAEAAGVQGKFWEMHDLLFENQQEISDEFIQELAKELELDMDQFNEALDLGTFSNKVTKDQLFGTQIGVNSTPTFFLNGKKMNFSDFTDFREQIETAIEQQSS